MKKYIALLAALLILATALTAAGCAKKDENSLAGTWSYTDETSGLGAVYQLKDNGTGTYTIQVGEQAVTYKLKYEVEDNHLLVRYVDNETFSEDDVFDSEFRREGADTLVIKDSSGTEMKFVRE